MIENKHFWLKFRSKFILKSLIFLLVITSFDSQFIMCKYIQQIYSHFIFNEIIFIVV